MTDAVILFVAVVVLLQAGAVVATLARDWWHALVFYGGAGLLSIFGALAFSTGGGP